LKEERRKKLRQEVASCSRSRRTLSLLIDTGTSKWSPSQEIRSKYWPMVESEKQRWRNLCRHGRLQPTSRTICEATNLTILPKLIDRMVFIGMKL